MYPRSCFVDAGEAEVDTEVADVAAVGMVTSHIVQGEGLSHTH